MEMEENENSTFSHLQSKEENQPVSSATSASPGTSADSDTLDCHSPSAKKRRVFDLRISATQTTINSKAVMNWQNMSVRMGMGAGGNGNKTRLNLGSGMGMGMNHSEWDGVRRAGLSNVHSVHVHSRPHHRGGPTTMAIMKNCY